MEKFNFTYINDHNLYIRLPSKLKVFDVGIKSIDIQNIYKDLIKDFIDACVCRKEVNITLGDDIPKIDYKGDGIIATFSPNIKGLSYSDEVEDIDFEDFVMVFEVIDNILYLKSMNLRYNSKYYVYGCDGDGCCYNYESNYGYSYNCLIL